MNRCSKKVSGIVLFALTIAIPLAGFFPWDYLTAFGALGTSHQTITRRAVEAVDRELFDVDSLTRPMRRALDEIIEHNADVDDKYPKESAKHFDGENFAAGQQWLQSNRAIILQSLDAGNTSSARQALGASLHTIQDFYSHSNWVEQHGTSPNPALGRPGSTPGPVASPSEATCQDCDDWPIPICNDCSATVTTSRLTSGYYGNQDREKPASVAKCSHGGPFDSTATGPALSFNFGINKDSSDCAFSPRHDLHTTAATAAEAATRQFIEDLADEATPSQMRLLLGGGPTLAIAIDTTGSMSPIIAQVKSEAIALVDARLGTPEEPSKYVLTPFSDPSVGPTLVTTDPDEFKAAIQALGANGGGDCPELAYTGMLQALAQTDPGGHLFLFTDASAKDAGRAGEVAGLAIRSGIRIQALRFGSCGESTAADRGQSPQRFDRSNWRELASDGSRFQETAESSGGQVFDLLVSEAGQVTGLADLTSRSRAVDIAELTVALTGTPLLLPIPVDSTQDRVTFAVSGTPDVLVRRPDSSAVAAGDPGVRLIPLTTGMIVSIEDPAAGSWTVELSGSGTVSLHVSGESPLDLASFEFIEPRGRPGHDGWYPVEGFPTSGEHDVRASMTGALQTVSFELRTRAGSVLQAFSLARGAGQAEPDLAGRLTLPNVPFLVYAVGLDSAGQPFQRLLPATARVQSVEVRPHSIPSSLQPGQTAVFVFKVTNKGDADEFSFSAADDQGFAGAPSPSTFPLPAGGSIEVAVEVTVPEGPPAAGAVTLTAVVRSNTAPEVSNFAVANSAIAAPEADLSLEKTVSAPGLVTLGSQLTYTLTVSNAGPGTATSVTVTDVLPPEVELVSVTSPCPATLAGAILTWNAGTIAPSESASCSVVVRVIATGPIVNTATVSLAEGDPLSSNNTSGVTVTVEGGIAEIPTLSSIGLALLTLVLAGGGMLLVRRRQSP